MPPYRYTACQLLELSNASRLNAEAWTTVIVINIAAKLPTRRGCRGGVRKQGIIQPVIGHRPPTSKAITSKQTGVDSANFVQLIAPVSALNSCTTATLGQLNVRSLRNMADFITAVSFQSLFLKITQLQLFDTNNSARLVDHPSQPCFVLDRKIAIP